MVLWGLLTCFSRKFIKNINNKKYITNKYFTVIYFKTSSKRKHNHNATAEVEYLENKTNNETDKQSFSAYLLNFFLFSSSSLILSMQLQCWLWIAHVSNQAPIKRSKEVSQTDQVQKFPLTAVWTSIYTSVIICACCVINFNTLRLGVHQCKIS